MSLSITYVAAVFHLGERVELVTVIAATVVFGSLNAVGDLFEVLLLLDALYLHRQVLLQVRDLINVIPSRHCKLKGPLLGLA